MEKTNLMMKDILKSLKWGVIIGGFALVALFLIIFLCTGFSVISTLTILRGIFLFSGSICLFVFAGFMIKNTFSEPMENNQQWKEYYRVLSPTSVLFVVAVIILGIGLIVDYIVIII